MNSGIYLLTFGEMLPYVGQSQDIEKRYSKHCQLLKSGSHSAKLQDAYTKYGLPELDILEKCDTDLDSKEEYYIQFFDSANNGLNTCEDSSPPVLKGTSNGRSKYSESQILEVVKLLSDPIYPFNTIAKLTGVGRSTINNIANGSDHSWVKDKYPDLYNSMKRARKY